MPIRHLLTFISTPSYDIGWVKTLLKQTTDVFFEIYKYFYTTTMEVTPIDSTNEVKGGENNLSRLKTFEKDTQGFIFTIYHGDSHYLTANKNKIKCEIERVEYE